MDKAGWWLVPGQPRQVLDWADAHRPPGAAPDGRGMLEIGVPSSSETFAFPAVAGVLDSRELIVTAVDAGGGQTAIRVDAEVTWLSDRSPAETVPAAAGTVTLGLVPGGNAGGTLATVTDPAKVTQLRVLVGPGLAGRRPAAGGPGAEGGGIELEPSFVAVTADPVR